MIVLWAVGRSDAGIHPREYDRVTDKCAFRKQGGREVRESLHQEFLHLFKSESEAISFVWDRLQRKLTYAKGSVTHAEAEIGKFKDKYGSYGSSISEVPAVRDGRTELTGD